MAETFNIFLIVMAVLAAGVYVALHFFEAGYGYLFNPKYGPPVPNKVGWVVMESPVFIAMCVLWLMSGRTWEAGPLALFVLFQAHYLQRAFIFPLMLLRRVEDAAGDRRDGHGVQHPQRADAGRVDLLRLARRLLRRLVRKALHLRRGSPVHGGDGRKPPFRPYHPQPAQAGRHAPLHSPRGDVPITSRRPNYFGELLEWTGFAVASWSWAGAVFAWWTFANLAPRAASLYKRYAQEFGKEFTALKRKKIIPFIY